MIVSRAPLRLSFFGGGTDFPEVFEHQPGAVLSTAIDYASVVSITRRAPAVGEPALRLVHRETERVDDPAAIRHPLLRAAFSERAVEPLEVHCSGDLPQGAGLGSSSSFSVALLQGLHALDGRSVAPLDLAYGAIELERRVSRGAVGCQDQVMAAVGGLRRLEFRAVDDIRAEPLPISGERVRELESHLVMFRVGGPRRASDLERKKLDRVERNRDTLRSMVDQVDRACDILCGSGSLAEIGHQLDRAWANKQRLAPGVSTPEIDDLYRRARGAGALGGKVLGAGGGGFLLLFVPAEHMEDVARAAARPALRPRLAQPGASTEVDGVRPGVAAAALAS
ncbi:MAG: GHMP kinase [Acidobacteriota bacterium]